MKFKVLRNSTEELYAALYEEEDARVCRDIPDEACSDVPQNFFLHAGAASLGKIADAIGSAKTTLPWLLASVGAPVWMTTFLVPIRESGSMLPQLAIGAWVRQQRFRKGFYVIGALVQALALLLAAGSLVVLEGAPAGFAVLVCLIFYSLARALCSIASKDVIGKTVPKTRRGRMNGIAVSFAGLSTLAAVAMLAWLQAGTAAYLSLVACAAGCWLLAALVFSQIEESPGATSGHGDGIAEALSRLGLLRSDSTFRNFVVCRVLLLGSALMAPLVVMLGQQYGNTSLTWFLLAQGLGSALSGGLWGGFADRSSRKLMLFCAAGVFSMGTVLALVAWFEFAPVYQVWFFPLAFLMLAVLHDGIRLGRKTYLLDMGGGNKRTDYVAVSNTVVGALLLVAGVVTSLIQMLGVAFAIAFFAVLALASVPVMHSLPEVQ